VADLLIVDDPRPGVRRITLNRPEHLNALSRALMRDLVAAFEGVEDDPEVRVVVLRGNGTSFCAGADLTEHFVGEDDAPDIGFSDLWDRLDALRVPVVAAVHGHAVTGGFLLAYSCDLIVAAGDAVFRDTHARLGIVPTGGETQRLPRRIGPFLARELFFTSRALPADEAYRAGLVNRVVAPDELEAASLELAERIAENSPHSVATIKRLVNAGLATDFGTGLRMERVANEFGRANTRPDPEREARMARFRSKAAPR
jgi:enoyl-CoA hydratase